jgi:urocanate hydratase
VTDANVIPDFASQYLQADLTQRGGLLTVVALSGDQDDLARVDSLFPALFPDSELQKWMAIARKHPSPGLSARSCWMKADEAVRLSLAINDLIARGEMKAPVAIGRTLRHNPAVSSPATPPASAPHAEAIADWPEPSGLLQAGAGASWLALGINAPADPPRRQGVSWAVVADGKPETAKKLERAFADDFAAVVSRFAPPRAER